MRRLRLNRPFPAARITSDLDLEQPNGSPGLRSLDRFPNASLGYRLSSSLGLDPWSMQVAHYLQTPTNAKSKLSPD